MSVQEFLEPASLDEACQLLAAAPEETKALAGGTAVALMLRQGLIAPERLVSLARLAELGGITSQGAFVRIGAGVTLTEVARDRLVQERLPSLAYACQRVGNVRVRNVATLGGNLAEADYASDPPAVLASLGGFCTVRNTERVRTVFVDELITGFYTTVLEPGELITEIVVPTPPSRRAVYLKYVSRSSEDRPCVGVAARADFDGQAVTEADVVVGAVAGTPQRLEEVCAALAGGALNDSAVAQVAERYGAELEPMDDARGSSWYRRRMITVFVRRALQALAQAGRSEEAHADG